VIYTKLMAKRKTKKSPKKSLIRKSQKKPKQKVSKLKLYKTKKIKIRVIGIGGGGSSIVSELASRMTRISFVVANTDIQALKTASKKALHFQFGTEMTRGLGTGMNAELGREIALKEKERIKKLLQGYDFCILVTCLGGGTGSGATPVFAKISQELGNITYGIFTLPFQFEGEKKMEIARSSLQKTRSKLDIFSVIPNERIFRIIDKKTPLRSALSMINESLAESLEGLIDMIYSPGLINIDFADFKTVISGSLLSQKKTKGQLAYLNTVAIARRKGTIKDLIEKVLYNPLYSYSVNGAKGALLNIGGEKNLSLAEVSRISKTISGLANKEAKIIFGVSQNKKYSGIIKTTLLATGCKARMFPSKPRSAKKKIISKISKAASAIIQKEPPKDIPKKIKKKLKPKSKPKSKPKKKKKVKKRRKKASSTKIIPIIHKSKIKASDVQGETRVRKNALQIKKEMEAEEKEILDKEKFWEAPAFLRKK